MKKNILGIIKQREKTMKYAKELQEMAKVIDDGDLSENTISKFQKLTQKFINAANAEEKLINDAESQIPSNPIQLSQMDITKKFNSFLKQKLSIDAKFTAGRACDLPFILPIYSIVCAKKSENNFITAIVLDYSDRNYLLCDVAKKNFEQSYFILPPESIAPLPTSFPGNVSKYFRKGDNVLTLFKSEGVWTSVFYPGTVVSTPKSNSKSIQVYFEDEGNSFSIPIQFSIHNYWIQK